MAGEAEVGTPGEGAPEARAAGNAARSITIPPEIKPAVDAYVDEAVKSAVKRTEREWQERVAEEKRLAAMSETERARTEVDKLSKQLEILKGEREYTLLERSVEREAQELGFVPAEILDAMLKKAVESGEPVDAKEVARKAHEKFQGYVGATNPQKRTAVTANRHGTPLASTGGDFASMSINQVIAKANELGGAKGAALLKQVAEFQMAGGLLAGE